MVPSRGGRRHGEGRPQGHRAEWGAYLPSRGHVAAEVLLLAVLVVGPLHRGGLGMGGRHLRTERDAGTQRGEGPGRDAAGGRAGEGHTGHAREGDGGHG